MDTKQKISIGIVLIIFVVLMSALFFFGNSEDGGVVKVVEQEEVVEKVPDNPFLEEFEEKDRYGTVPHYSIEPIAGREGWLKYTNSVYGFSIDIPKGFTIKDANENSVTRKENTLHSITFLSELGVGHDSRYPDSPGFSTSIKVVVLYPIDGLRGESHTVPIFDESRKTWFYGDEVICDQVSEGINQGLNNVVFGSESLPSFRTIIGGGGEGQSGYISTEHFLTNKGYIITLKEGEFEKDIFSGDLSNKNQIEAEMQKAKESYERFRFSDDIEILPVNTQCE